MRRALFLSLVLTAGTARANGRFPESNHVFFAPSDDRLVVVRTTFGLLVSHDRGASWSWVCEQALPLNNSEDPMLAITPSNVVLATTYGGLSIARDGGCSWSRATGDLADRMFIDLAADPAAPGRVVVFASAYDHQDDAGSIFFSSKLWETTDDGQSFGSLGPDLDATLSGSTVDLAKSDPARVYVSAVRDPGTPGRAAVLLASKDHGKTWTEDPIALTGTEHSVFIAAVDPSNADKVYVRTSNDTDAPTRLLLTEDGGATWRTIYAARAALLGFALSADGSKVWVGGPKEGIQVASTADFSFQQTSTIPVQCLASASDGLWACSGESSGFIVALSKDDGRTFEKKTRFCDIAGVLACAQGSTVDTQCAPLWSSQRATLGCAGATRDAGDDASGGGDGGAAPSAGGSDAGGDAGATPGGGCDCRQAPRAPLGALAGGAIVALVVRRRRRRGL